MNMYIIVKKHTILYKIWFYLKSNKPMTSLPNKKNLFFLTGYPRSGNSYFKNLLNYLNSKLNFCSHLHTIASIKIALKIRIPVYVIIRQPLESISSWSVMRCNSLSDQKKTLDYCLKEYVSYYQFLNKNRRHLQILIFDDIITNKIDFLNLLNLPDFDINKDLYVKRLNDFQQNSFMKNKQSKMSKSHLTKFSSTPNLDRNKEKDKFKVLLKKESDFLIAQQLYDNLN